MVPTKPIHRVVRSVARALELLELLASHPEGLTLSQIGEQLDVPLSSLHGIAATLAAKGFVVREEYSLLYRLGPQIPHLSASYQASHDVISLANPTMVEIRDQVQETTSLSVLHDGVIVFVHKQPASDKVITVNPVGTHVLAHATGSGKVLLAQLPEEEIDRIYPLEELPTLTERTIGTKTQLKKALAEVRRLGYAYDNEESQQGIWAVAACIQNAQGYPMAALSIVGPLFRVKTKEYGQWHELIVEGAARVSSLMGYRAG